jgi:tetratricopeptide (TPR) repeat protein
MAKSREAGSRRVPRADPSSWRTLRAGLVGVTALAMAVEVARLTASSAVAPADPDLAYSLAPNDPAALRGTGMAQIGEAAARGSNPSSATLERFRTLAHAAPLAAEPFLVQAALAEKAGDLARAERLLLDARWRDPRSAAARYLLADVSLKLGKPEQALAEMAILTRLFPSTADQLVPALSQYARSPGAAGELNAILRDNPKLRGPLLKSLAADPANAELVIALAGTTRVPGDSGGWQKILIEAFVDRGDFDSAYGLWARLAGVSESPRPLLFNGDFRPSDAPAPFNWTLSSGSGGVAEPENGRLRILFYGRQDRRLAMQLLLLPPGRYRFVSPASGSVESGALEWTLRCQPSRAMILRAAVGAGEPATFIVPQSGCSAQRLELNGNAQDAPQDTDVAVGPLRLERLGS